MFILTIVSYELDSNTVNNWYIYRGVRTIQYCQVFEIPESRVTFDVVLRDYVNAIRNEGNVSYRSEQGILIPEIGR